MDRVWNENERSLASGGQKHGLIGIMAAGVGTNTKRLESFVHVPGLVAQLRLRYP